MQTLQEQDLSFVDPPSIAWIRVSDAAKLLWVDNPKLHDIGGLAQSFQRYGLQELPKFDSKLPNISGEIGAIKAGNGRIETLAKMEKDGGEVPRGLAILPDTGEWVVPVLVGTDADSVNNAIAYAVDSNSLTLSGGDYSIYEYLKLYDSKKFSALLSILAEDGIFTVAIDDESIDAILLNNAIGCGELGQLDKIQSNDYKDIVIRVYEIDLYKEIVTEIKTFVGDKWKLEIRAYD